MVPLFLLPLLAASTAAFTVPSPRVVPTISNAATAYYSTPPTRSCPSVIWRQQMAASDGNDEAASTAPSPPPIKRRKRKDGNTFSPPSSLVMESESVDKGDAMSATASTRTDPPPEETRPAPAATPPTANNVMVMKVRDIRDVVSGAPESPTYDEEGGAYDDAEEEDEDEEGADDIDDGDELADDEEWEYYDVDEDGREIVASSGRQRSAGGDASSGGTRDDPINQLLADARRMRASSEGQSQTKTKGVKEIIFEVISTIVTVDFFLVLALLVWFLAGIFCSYVLKDDAVQIAFNMNFERLTQP
jgi:hypothetical protein